MKLWVKIFLITMFFFVIAFAVGAVFLTEKAFSFNREREVESGIREQSVILSSVENRIKSIEQIQTDISTNPLRLSAVVQPLSVYYSSQNVLLALYMDDTAVYSDIPDISDIEQSLLTFRGASVKNYTDTVADGTRFLLVASPLENYPHLTFVYARDISQTDDFRKEISRSYRNVSAVVLLLLGGSIYLLLRHLTRPVSTLNAITAQIAGGDYSKRVDINRSDEFGTLGFNFNLMADSVERSMERKQQFIDNLTHEMKTPLTAISGYAEFLQNVNCSERERVTAAGHLRDMALRLESLSGKLLDLAFMRESQIVMKPCNVADLFESLEKMSPHKLVIHNDTTVINGDETLLLSMLTNLTENAARACGADGVITVRAYDNVIEVADTGHGMESGEIEKVAAPFYRVDASRSRKFGGVGLGLSIVSAIAEVHGARIVIESEVGVGTVVKVVFNQN
ncbi:MAG: HAMP domain-containing histidine kinase [Oscillospiraceae bacterium]|nr:HAMP domain-containing histidine kinase [Oscillospiraceae bacterium]